MFADPAVEDEYPVGGFETDGGAVGVAETVHCTLTFPVDFFVRVFAVTGR